MTNETIGMIDCPCCGLEAEVRTSKKSKAYILCSDCGFQGFARGYDADKKLRDKMKPVEISNKEAFDKAMKTSHKTQLKETEKPADEEDTIFDKLGF